MLFTDPRCQYIPSDISYLFYSLKNPDKPDLIPSDKFDGIKNAHFDASKETIFLVHGGGGNTSGPLVLEVKAAMVKAKLDINVVAVDWRAFQNRNKAINVYTCADLFGILVAKFLTALAKDRGLKYSKTTMVGHSIAGRFMTNIGAQLKGELRAMIGLETCVMNKKDAKFVEVRTMFLVALCKCITFYARKYFCRFLILNRIDKVNDELIEFFKPFDVAEQTQILDL